MSSLTRKKKKELYKTRENSRSLKLDRPSRSHTDTVPIKDEKVIAKMMDLLKLEIRKAEGKSDWQRYIPYRNYIMVLLGLNTALREEDILQLKAIDLIKNRFTITENKTMKDQRFFLNKAVQEEVIVYINEFKIEDNEYLFQSRNTDKLKDAKPITRVQAYQIMHKLGLKLGINYTFGMHSLRKTFGYHYVMKSKDKAVALLNLQKIYNHGSIKTTQLYISWTDDDVESTRQDFYLGIKPWVKRN